MVDIKNYSKNINGVYKINKLAELTNKNLNKDKLKKVSEDFAAIFIKLMLNEMKKTLHQEKNPLYGGLAEDIWSDMLYDEYSKLFAKSGLNSISQMVYQALKK